MGVVSTWVVGGLLATLLVIQWISLTHVASKAMPGAEMRPQLAKLEAELSAVRVQLTALEESRQTRQKRQAALQDALERGGGVGSPRIGQTTLRVVMSTMRRGLEREYIYATLDSLLPYLGSHGPLHVAVTVVDVERGQGEFADELRAAFGELVEAGLLQVEHLDDESRAVLYSSLRETCSMHRLYGDDLARTLWRSKRALDFVFVTRLSAASGAAMMLVLEDDTPLVGSLALVRVFSLSLSVYSNLICIL